MASETIHLLHTNDVHSHLENWPRIQRFLLDQQAQDVQCLTFDIGDAIDRLHPLTDATMGKGNVALMNAVHYDAVTIGNNEGLVLPHEAMATLYEQANFDVVVSNLKTLPDLTQPAWAKPYKILTTTQGTRIGVLGLTAPYTLTYPALGWQPEPVDATIDRLLPVLQAQADVVILLSHLGLPTDEELAEKYPIDVIIGAHTHHLLEHGKMVNGTLLAAAGRYGNHVGEITLTLENHQVTAQTARVTPTYEMAEADDDFQMIHGWLQTGQTLLKKQVITQIPRDISADEQSYDALRALKAYFGVSIAMVSTGMFVDDLPAGVLSDYELLESMPHAINPMLMTLTGADIVQMLSEITDQQARLATLAIKGSGFRGKTFGYLRFNGLDHDAKGQIWLAGEKLVLDQTYQIATLDHYKWLPFFPVVQQAPVDIAQSLLLRELMAQYYRTKYQKV